MRLEARPVALGVATLLRDRPEVLGVDGAALEGEAPRFTGDFEGERLRARVEAAVALRVGVLTAWAGEGSETTTAAAAFLGVLLTGVALALAGVAALLVSLALVQKPVHLQADQQHLQPSFMQKPRLVVRASARDPTTLGMGHFCQARSQSSGMTMAPAQDPAQRE